MLLSQTSHNAVMAWPLTDAFMVGRIQEYTLGTVLVVVIQKSANSLKTCRPQKTESYGSCKAKRKFFCFIKQLNLAMFRTYRKVSDRERLNFEPSYVGC